MINIMNLLKAMVDKNASDLHLRVGVTPTFRINGELFRIQAEPLTLDLMTQFISDLIPADKQSIFAETNELDCAVGLKGIGRFRINAYKQRGTPSLAIRLILSQIPTFDALHYPQAILDIAMKERGLILVTGTTGSGKSTLLSSMIDYINDHKSVNIITVEDPVEHLYRDKRSIIAQREIGQDSHSFHSALRSSFRQDPDVLLIGEIRDIETMETSISAADTGHLVMSTLHTMNCVETISRIVSFFPPHQHQQIRLVLSSVLVAIISLRLIPRKDGQGRVPATEILVNHAAIAEYIMDPQQQHQILQAVGEGYTQYGSQTFDQSLMELYQQELISFEVAKQSASNPDDLEMKIRGISGTSDRRWIN